MAEVEAIPVRPGLPHQRMNVNLDGRDFGLVFRWSMREARWYLDLFDTTGAPLVLTIKIVANEPLLADVRGSGLPLPPGELIALDQRAEPTDPDLQSLGDSVIFAYMTPEQIAAALAEIRRGVRTPRRSFR